MMTTASACSTFWRYKYQGAVQICKNSDGPDGARLFGGCRVRAGRAGGPVDKDSERGPEALLTNENSHRIAGAA